MRYRVLVGFLVAIGSLLSTEAFANCGPFNIWEPNDYCVACPDGGMKVNSCPGGEAGKVALGVNFPGCQISFFDPKTCKLRPTPLTKEDLTKLEAQGHFKRK
jgi:hypothetical protein